MDSVFERALLERIDSFLAGGLSYGEFEWFRSSFAVFYSSRRRALLAGLDSRVGDSPNDWVNSEVGEQVDRIANEQLPDTRAQMFEFVRDSAVHTVENPTEEERRYGYQSLAEFVSSVARRRVEYRATFGV